MLRLSREHTFTSALTPLNIIAQIRLDGQDEVGELPEAKSHVLISVVATDDQPSICAITRDSKAVKSLNELIDTKSDN